MNKVLINLYVLKIDEEYEVFLPPNKKIGDLICMMIKSLHEITNGVYPLDNRNILFDVDQNIFLDPNLSLKEGKIYNGKKLILI